MYNKPITHYGGNVENDLDILPIPNSKNYTISKDGTVWDENKNERKIYTNGDGYKTVCINFIDKGRVTIGQHRMLMLVFKPPTGDPSKLTVNHIDRDITNNDLNNLEWLTVRQNNIHASVTHENPPCPRVILESINGDLIFVNNLQEVSKILNVSEREAWESLRDGTRLGIDKQYYIHHHGSKSNVPENIKGGSKSNSPKRNGVITNGVKMLNVRTNEELRFPTYIEAGKYFGVSHSHIIQCMSFKDTIKSFKSSWILVPLNEDYPDITPDIKKRIIQSGKRSVIYYNLTTETWGLTDSAAAFIKLTGLSKKAVSTRLKKDKIEKVGDYIFTYEDKTSIDRLKSIIDCPE